MKIGELAQRAGVATSAIRFYESAGLMPAPQRGPNGYRVYDEDSLQRLLAILMAQRLGFGLQQLRGLMQAEEELPNELVVASLQARLQEIDAMVQALAQQRAEAQALLTRLTTSWAQGECLNLPDAQGRADPPRPLAQDWRRRKA